MQIKKIALVVSGGDAPGINAAIRAVVRTANYYDIKVIGVLGGYEGLIDGNFILLDAGSVSNIIHKGGSILNTSRSRQFKTKAGRKRAFEKLKQTSVGGVVLIGGDGSLAGANAFTKEYKMPWAAIPKTIDNDTMGTDYAIGYDTAVNTAVEAIDRIRDTAEAHERMFFIEVMGRDSGFIALEAGIASGAESILIPEMKDDYSKLISRLQTGWKRKKSSMIVIVAEGDEHGRAYQVADTVKKHFPNYDIKVSILGHIQRGGCPTVKDRVLASRLGFEAVEALVKGKRNCMIGIINNNIQYTQFSKIKKRNLTIKEKLIKMTDILSG